MKYLITLLMLISFNVNAQSITKSVLTFGYPTEGYMTMLFDLKDYEKDVGNNCAFIISADLVDNGELVKTNLGYYDNGVHGPRSKEYYVNVSGGPIIGYKVRINESTSSGLIDQTVFNGNSRNIAKIEKYTFHVTTVCGKKDKVKKEYSFVLDLTKKTNKDGVKITFFSNNHKVEYYSY